MTNYAYETVPQKSVDGTRYYLIKQNSGDAPLTIHPETGGPIRRVVLGELGELTFPERQCPAEDNSSLPAR